ncbi:hypothetical protein SBI_02680 [Streptomyces bingchenggensis BCW-1]|uniref:Uncharacterized protein n=1 Tax=Streptomyces bingchenggensis (strain BCW-1) TaxID=749414 RepID=D7C0S9_STRBB|nr:MULTISPECIES: hypothetical protein [Streptomyces]ADI05801.1 hypothetical protein SBI_02680 [Streptomyces bingchenggensis BCW-1]
MDATGTPDDLLAVLPGGDAPASVPHISCHAVAGPHPTRSALRPAASPDADLDGGLLTVARILDDDDAAADRPPAGHGRPTGRAQHLRDRVVTGARPAQAAVSDCVRIHRRGRQRQRWHW